MTLREMHHSSECIIFVAVFGLVSFVLLCGILCTLIYYFVLNIAPKYKGTFFASFSFNRLHGFEIQTQTCVELEV